MRNRNLVVVLILLGTWALMPRGVARAQVPADSYPYVSCSTGAPPYLPTTVGPNSSVEQQAFCNAGDSATGGGIEVLSPSLPLPPGVLVTTPENSFHQTTPDSGPLSGVTYPDGWQVVLQNTNLNPLCAFAKKGSNLCPAVQYRVCVACVQTEIPAVY